MTFIEAAVTVLEREGRPLSSRAIAEKAVSLGVLSHVGKTPVQTMSARISAAVAKGGSNAVFVRVGRGVFGLASWNGKPPGPAKVDPVKAPEKDAAPTAKPPAALPSREAKVATAVTSQPLEEEPPPAHAPPGVVRKPNDRTEEPPPAHAPREASGEPAPDSPPAAKKRKRRKRKGSGNGAELESKPPLPADTAEPAPPPLPKSEPPPPARPSPAHGDGGEDLMDRVEALLRRTEKPLATAEIISGMGLAGPATAMLLEALMAADGLDRESRGQRARFVKHKSGYRLLEREISSEIVSLERQAGETRERLLQIAERQVLRRLRGLSMGGFARVMITYLHRSGFGAMIPVDLASPGEFHLSVQDRRHRGRFRTAVVLRKDPVEHTLSERSVMDLRGAIHHYDAMGGMILTTGRVMEKAIVEGRIANLPPVALIDGETLARELVRLGIGIKSRTISLPAFDEAFFSALE